MTSKVWTGEIANPELEFFSLGPWPQNRSENASTSEGGRAKIFLATQVAIYWMHHNTAQGLKKKKKKQFFFFSFPLLDYGPNLRKKFQF